MTNKPILVFKAMQANGQDPYIGAKLNALLQEINFDVIEAQEKFLSYSKWRIKSDFTSY